MKKLFPLSFLLMSIGLWSCATMGKAVDNKVSGTVQVDSRTENERAFRGCWTRRDMNSVTAAIHRQLKEDKVFENYLRDYGKVPRVTVGYFDDLTEDDSIISSDMEYLSSRFGIELNSNKEIKFTYGSPRSDRVYTFRDFEDGRSYGIFLESDLVLEGSVETKLGKGDYNSDIRIYTIRYRFVEPESGDIFYENLDGKTFKRIRLK